MRAYVIMYVRDQQMPSLTGLPLTSSFASRLYLQSIDWHNGCIVFVKFWFVAMAVFVKSQLVLCIVLPFLH